MLWPCYQQQQKAISTLRGCLPRPFLAIVPYLVHFIASQIAIAIFIFSCSVSLSLNLIKRNMQLMIDIILAPDLILIIPSSVIVGLCIIFCGSSVFVTRKTYVDLPCFVLILGRGVMWSISEELGGCSSEAITS